MLVIYRKELRSYFTNMTGIIFAAFLLLVNGIYTVAYNLNGGYPQYEYTLSSIEFVFLILIPILTMRSLADERSRKTDQLLYSLPMKMSNIIVGKYLAMVTVFTLPVILMTLDSADSFCFRYRQFQLRLIHLFLHSGLWVRL